MSQAIAQPGTSQFITVEGETYNTQHYAGRTEVWDEEWAAKLFTVPVHWTLDEIRVAVEIYNAGYVVGKRVGESAKAYEIRKALGIQ